MKKASYEVEFRVEALKLRLSGLDSKLALAFKSKDGGEGDWAVWSHTEDGRWAPHEDVQSRIEALLENGWEPVGYIRITNTGVTGYVITIESSVFAGYATDPAAETVLQKISQNLAVSHRNQLVREGKTVKMFDRTDMRSWKYCASLYISEGTHGTEA